MDCLALELSWLALPVLAAAVGRPRDERVRAILAALVREQRRRAERAAEQARVLERLLASRDGRE